MRKTSDNLPFGALIVVFSALIVMMCIMTGQKSYGLEGDEVFSYISSTSQGGFKGVCFLEDQTWYGGDYFYDALTATGSERFNIPMVVENQVMDTHPPLFYIFLNFVCSFFPSRFSKWFGIGLNIFFLLLVAVGLFLLLNHFIKNKYLSLILSTVFCCSRLSVSMVLFIRMYVLLMACFLFQSWYHLVLYRRVSQQDDFSIKRDWKSYLVVVGLTVIGALTHYYFLVYQAMISALFVLALWKRRRVRQSVPYIVSMIISGIVYCVLYPAVFEHLFFKYRGRDAVHKFLKETSLLSEGMRMLTSFNESLFKGNLVWLLGGMAALSVVLVIRKKFRSKALGEYALLIAPAIVYFWGISKASPYTTLRYVVPVAALIYAFLVLWLLLIVEGIGYQKAGYAVCCILLGCVVIFCPVRSVKERYFEERAQIVAELAETCDYCVYITGDEYNWKMWEDYVIYPEFEGLFFMDGQKKAQITDKDLLEQKELVLFIDNTLPQDEMYSWLTEAFEGAEFKVRYEAPYVHIVSMHTGAGA